MVLELTIEAAVMLVGMSEPRRDADISRIAVATGAGVEAVG